METIQEKAQALIEERNQLIGRINEINGSLKILDELAKEAEQKEETTTEEES